MLPDLPVEYFDNPIDAYRVVYRALLDRVKGRRLASSIDRNDDEEDLPLSYRNYCIAFYDNRKALKASIKPVLVNVHFPKLYPHGVFGGVDKKYPASVVYHALLRVLIGRPSCRAAYWVIKYLRSKGAFTKHGAQLIAKHTMVNYLCKRTYLGEEGDDVSMYWVLYGKRVIAARSIEYWPKTTRLNEVIAKQVKKRLLK